jgi:hypothetical protein
MTWDDLPFAFCFQELKQGIPGHVTPCDITYPNYLSIRMLSHENFSRQAS